MIFFAVVDHENNATDWWDSAREHADSCPEWARRFISEFDCGSISTESPDEFFRFVEWCRSVPGWNAGPSHARNPLVFSGSSVAAGEKINAQTFRVFF